MASHHSLGSINSEDDTNVLIIGAGISGLTAAFELMKRDPGLRILVIEAKGHVGGRTLTRSLKTSKGNENFDFGGVWVSSLHSHLLKLLKQLDLEIYPQYSKGIKAGKAGVPSWRTFEHFPLFGTWFTRCELYRFVQKIEKLVGQISETKPMNHKNSEVLNCMTMENFITDNLSTLAARDIMRTLIRMQFGTEPNDVSVLFFLVHCHSSYGFLNYFMSTQKGLREFRIKGGAEQISQRLAEKIGKHTVILSEPVVEIIQDDNFVFASTANGKVYRGERLILAVPPSEVLRIDFRPPLPVRLRHVLQRFLPGQVTQFVITYDRPYWREAGYSGQVFDYGATPRHRCCKTSPITMMCDVTTEKGGAALMGQLTSHNGLEWLEAKCHERKKAILDTIFDLWGSWVLNPLDYLEINWSEQPYAGGSPSHFFGPGMMPWLNIVHKPHHRVHWAGSEAAYRWKGSMNGAVESGLRASIEVLYEIRPQVLTAVDLESIGKEIVEKQEPVTPRFPFHYKLIYGPPVVLIIGSCVVLYCLLKYFPSYKLKIK